MKAEGGSVVVMNFTRRKPAAESESHEALKGSDDGGTLPPMEGRIAKLEANMEHVRSELAKLATVPADLATVKERTAHMPTKADVLVAVDTAIEKAAVKTQRTTMLVGAAITIVLGLINIGSRLIH